MQNNEQVAWDEAKRAEAATDPYDDRTVMYPQGFQPAATAYGQEGYGQNAYAQSAPPPYESNAGQPAAFQNTAYQGNVPPPLPPVPPTPVSGQPSKSGKPSINRLLLIAAAVVLVLLLGIGGFVLLPALTGGNHAQTAASATPAPVTTPGTKPANPANRNIYTAYLAQYRPGIRDQVALGLHLTPDQLETQLAAGKTLSSIATAQGLTAAQLQTLVTNSFQNAFQPAINSNSLTQKQVTALINRMLKQPKTLDKYLEIRPAKHAAKATPTVAAQ